MFKKIIPVFLCAVILIFSMAACGNEPNAAVSTVESVSEASEPAQTSEPLPAVDASNDSQSESEAPAVEEEPPPDNNWEFDVPENHGVDAALLEELHGAIKEKEIYSVVIAKDGYIIDEYYKTGYDENSVFRLASCTKSFSGALIGIAIDKGLIGGVDESLTEYFPQLADSNDENKLEITVEHLLTHTSGLYWSEWAGGDYFSRLSKSENWVEFVLSQNMASKPGTVFNYTTGGSHLLAAVLQEAAGETAYDFGTEYLFKPLGMDSVKWRADPQGVTDGGNGISMTARDAAKFGQLYLDGGRWKDRQVIPEAWVAESTARQADGSSGTGEYGYSWWLKSFGQNKAYSAYYAMGHGGQYIFVVPELKLVTVITSRFSDTYAPQYYFNDYIIAACG